MGGDHIRAPRRGKGKPPKVDEAVRRKADQLTDQGMPYQMAMAVAHGRIDLSEALERMARKDRVTKLMERHDLSRALATQVAIGHAELDQVLGRRRLDTHREENRDRTCLQPGGGPVALQLQARVVKGTVTALEPYTFTIDTGVANDSGSTTETIHKLEAKYGYAPGDWKTVKKVVRSEKKSADADARPATRPQDRYSCSDKRLFGYLDRGDEVDVTLLDGDSVRGVVTWFGRYEFGLEVKSGVEITVFRHALRAIRNH
jgi:sRNA-binding regulator protein Hfq